MGAVGIGVADAVEDRNESFVVQATQGFKGRVEPLVRVYFQYLFRGDSEGRPEFIVQVVSIRHDGIQAVIAPGELDDDQDFAAAPLVQLAELELI